MGRRSIYFFKYSQDEHIDNISRAFIDFVIAHKPRRIGKKGSFAGFLIDNIRKEPLVRRYGTNIEVKYGIEIVKEITRLNGEKEIYHLPRISEVVLDHKDGLVGVYTPIEAFAEVIYDDLKKGFTDKNGLRLDIIKYDSDFVHWLVKNAKIHSKIFTDMRRVMAENDEEVGIIYHADDILNSVLYDTIDKSKWKNFSFVEGQAYLKGTSVTERWCTVRIYRNGKLTITDPNPQEVGKIINRELADLHEIYTKEKSGKK